MPEQHAHCELCQTTINKYLLLQILNMEAGSSSFHWLSRYKDTFALAGGNTASTATELLSLQAKPETRARRLLSASHRLSGSSTQKRSNLRKEYEYKAA